MSKIEIIQINKNPKRRKKKMRKVIVRQKKKRRVIKLKKNPPARKRHETIIVGYMRNKFAGMHKGKRVYFNGTGFTHRKYDVKIFPGDTAKAEARRILPMLPNALYGIKVEPV